MRIRIPWPSGIKTIAASAALAVNATWTRVRAVMPHVHGPAVDAATSIDI